MIFRLPPCRMQLPPPLLLIPSRLFRHRFSALAAAPLVRILDRPDVMSASKTSPSPLVYSPQTGLMFFVDLAILTLHDVRLPVPVAVMTRPAHHRQESFFDRLPSCNLSSFLPNVSPGQLNCAPYAPAPPITEPSFYPPGSVFPFFDDVCFWCPFRMRFFFTTFSVRALFSP